MWYRDRARKNKLALFPETAQSAIGKAFSSLTLDSEVAGITHSKFRPRSGLSPRPQGPAGRGPGVRRHDLDLEHILFMTNYADAMASAGDCARSAPWSAVTCHRF